jgi:GNAT superfamily N-acetyltransferase
VPLLPALYEQTHLIQSLLREVISTNPAIAAFSEGNLAGYLTGYLIPTFKGRSPGVYCPEWAHAAVGKDKIDIYYALLKSISQQWVSQGHTAHALTILAEDVNLKDFLSWNGFGLLVVDALRGVEEVEPSGTSEGQIRTATENDLKTIFTFENALNEFSAESPIFRYAQAVQERNVQRALIDENYRFWIIEQAGRREGYLSVKRHNTDACKIIQDQGTLSIVGAYVEPEVRKRGLGRQLLNAALNWARQSQFARCSVDFESQNFEGSSFWLRYFTPVCYSFLRKIDERIVV